MGLVFSFDQGFLDEGLWVLGLFRNNALLTEDIVPEAGSVDVLLLVLLVLSNCWWVITDHSVSSLGLTSTCIVNVVLRVV